MIVAVVTLYPPTIIGQYEFNRHARQQVDQLAAAGRPAAAIRAKWGGRLSVKFARGIDPAAIEQDAGLRKQLWELCR